MAISDMPKDQQLTDSLFRKIAAYVYDAARINLTDKKKELVRARIGKMIRQRNLKGYRDYYEWMMQDDTGEAMREVLNAISTNLTSFFREAKHLEFLAEDILPGLEHQKGRGNRTLRGWSAGCSTGEEIYSIAITVAECLPDCAAWTVKLLATDIDTTVIETGSKGVYNAQRLQNVDAQLMRKYFQRGEGAGSKDLYKVKPILRQMVTFGRLNLMHPFPFRHKFDFIFCRNVMIYFDRPTQQGLIDKFYEVLAPGGYLFIGHSEGLAGIDHQFKYARPTVYQKP